MHSRESISLGQYLRRQRERLRPEDFGIGPTLRRRAPGLRREELAQLCAVSPTWITWLEQGRAVNASVGLLDRIAGALRLGVAERHYLFALAGRVDPRPSPAASTPISAVAALPRHIRTPAYVLDESWNAVAWNKPAQQLFVGWLDDQAAAQHNLLVYTFLSPRARELIESWPERARRLVAEFRAESARHRDSSANEELVRRLSRDSPEFAACWNNQTVAEREGGQRVFRHPDRGRLVYQQTTLYAAMSPAMKLVVLAPAPDGNMVGRRQIGHD